MEETALSDSGVPICLKCLDARTKGKPPATEPQIRYALLHDILQATALNNEATKEFDSVIGQFPSGLPPDERNGLGMLPLAYPLLGKR